MKNLVLFLSFVCLGLFNAAYSQNTQIYLMDSTSACSSIKELGLYISVGDIEEVNPIITINWGDGTTNVVNDQTFAANYQSYLYFTHTYNNVGVYTTSATFESTVTSDVYTSNLNEIVVSDVTNCGYVYSYVYQNTNCGLFWGNYLENAVFDLVGNDNVTTNFTGYLSGLNINNVPYTLSLNEDWLAENNLSQESPDLIITGFDPNGGPIYQGQDYMFTVSSNNVSTTLDLAFYYGYSACFSPSENGYISFSMLDVNCDTDADVLITMELPDFITPVTAGLTNPVLNGNILTFEIHDFNGYGWYYIPVTIPGTTEGGVEYTIPTTISDMNGGETELGNNSMVIIGMVYNSYDPNDKIVNRAENLDPGTAEKLQYTINFQNEGNFDALKVVVRDTLSENLDLATFKVINTKHAVVTELNPATRVVTFTFNSINLTPSSQNEEASKGQIVYEITEKANLPVNSEIENTAYIYFDFNPAIITNTTYNVNTVLSVNELNKASFSVHPNPANSTVKMTTGTKDNTLRILDLNGKEIAKTAFDFNTTVDISGISNGVYSLVLENKKGISIEKLVIQH
ncbi:MAG: hypothetical protein K0R65_317 [Crocinitomicaceae bacterium]|jgi:uncharacterized repeat protein (TIGR01451 family)|nr:hypothetical protein [Crocinitomicaceae bacterium]